MRLHRFSIHTLAGLPDGLTVTGLDSHLNVIAGPNASGKTRLCHAFRLLLYPQERSNDIVQLEAELVIDEKTYVVARVGNDIRWQDKASLRAVSAPPLPEHRFVGCYILTIEDFFQTGQTEASLHEYIRRELSGGYDLSQIRQHARWSLKSNHARQEADVLHERARALRTATVSHRALIKDEARLSGLYEALHAAEAAAVQLTQWQAVASVRQQHEHLSRLTAQLAQFPTNMAAIRGDELESYTRLHGQLEQLASRIEKVEGKRQQALMAYVRVAPPSSLQPWDEHALARMRTQITALREARLHKITTATHVAETEPQYAGHCRCTAWANTVSEV